MHHLKLHTERLTHLLKSETKHSCLEWTAINIHEIIIFYSFGKIKIKTWRIPENALGISELIHNLSLLFERSETFEVMYALLRNGSGSSELKSEFQGICMYAGAQFSTGLILLILATRGMIVELGFEDLNLEFELLSSSAWQIN